MIIQTWQILSGMIETQELSSSEGLKKRNQDSWWIMFWQLSTDNCSSSVKPWFKKWLKQFKGIRQEMLTPANRPRRHQAQLPSDQFAYKFRRTRRSSIYGKYGTIQLQELLPWKSGSTQWFVQPIYHHRNKKVSKDSWPKEKRFVRPLRIALVIPMRSS